jgi:hypothetical protein
MGLSGTYQELAYFNLASFTAKASFTSEVSINDVAGGGAVAELPPYFFGNTPYGVGKALRIVARGLLSTTGTPTFTPTIRLGTKGSTTGPIILGSPAAITTGSGITTKLFEIEGDAIMRAIGDVGAASTMQGLGQFRCSGVASPFVYDMFGGAASPGTVATVDTSITNYINVNFACSASSASNIVQLLQLQVWLLNAV